jgi:CHAT domain-containing protein/tetratricopeptide (TPR) repeat protein
LIMRSMASKWRAGITLALVLAGSLAFTSQDHSPKTLLTAEKKGPSAGWQALAQRGAYPEAVDALKAWLFQAKAGTREKAVIYHALGYLLLYARRAGEAAQSLQAAREWAMAQGLPREAASFEAEMAIQKALAKAIELRNSGDIAGSNAGFEKADRLALSAGNRPYEMKIVSDWSLNYLGLKEGRARSLALSERALALADSLGYRHEAAGAAEKIGAYYALNNDYSQALSSFLHALEDLSQAGGEGDRVACLNNVAMIYGALGDYVKARDYLQEAVAGIPGGAGEGFESSLLINLGNVFAGLVEPLRSDDYQHWALDCFEIYMSSDRAAQGGQLRPQALAGQARVYIDQGRLDEAREILLPALDMARRAEGALPTVGTVVSLLGDISLRTGSVPEAERYFEEARGLAERTGNSSLAISAIYGLGRTAEARQKLDQAADAYELAIRLAGEGFAAVPSDIQRASSLGLRRGPFQALLRLYLLLARSRDKAVYDREIFRLAEYFRGRSYLEFQARLAERTPETPLADPQDTKLAGERLELLRLLSQVGLASDARKVMEARVVQIDDLLDTAVFDRRRDPGPVARSSKPVPLELLQSRIPDDRTAILEYVLGETASVVMCVRRNVLDLVELPSDRELESAVTGFLSFLGDPSIPPDKGLPAARRLYRILFAPIERSLPASIDRLVIVPDGVLFRLPFEALAPPAAGSASPVYLNDRFIISYAPSASALLSSPEKRDMAYAKDALAFGVSKYAKPKDSGSGTGPLSPGAVLDDLYGRHGFEAESLPNVRAEIADLKRRLAPGRADVFEGSVATERALKSIDLSRYRLIHLACHAFSDDNYPLRSALRLAARDGEGEDGYLQVSEMYVLRTNADLVVLSSCQTGRGTIVTNEGNLGLPRVFFYMGARSVLSTLWQVNDRAAALFMKSFYDGYFRGLGKAEALQAAKRAMMRTRFAHPVYWASFVLTGGFQN